MTSWELWKRGSASRTRGESRPGPGRVVDRLVEVPKPGNSSLTRVPNVAARSSISGSCAFVSPELAIHPEKRLREHRPKRTAESLRHRSGLRLGEPVAPGQELREARHGGMGDLPGTPLHRSHVAPRGLVHLLLGHRKIRIQSLPRERGQARPPSLRTRRVPLTLGRRHRNDDARCRVRSATRTTSGPPCRLCHRQRYYRRNAGDAKLN